MNHLVLMVLFVVIGLVLQGVKKIGRRTVPRWAPFSAWFVALLVFLSTSFVFIEQDKIGHLKRVLFAADILGQGFISLHWSTSSLKSNSFQLLRFPKAPTTF